MIEFRGLVTGMVMFLTGLWITVLIAVPYFGVFVARPWGTVKEVPVEIAFALLTSNMCWASICLFVGGTMGRKTR